MVRPQDISEFAGRIYDEASRLTSLVQDIIEISKLDEKAEKCLLKMWISMKLHRISVRT